MKGADEAVVYFNKYGAAEEINCSVENIPLQRAGQPEAVAPSDVFPALEDTAYMAGHILHPNGGVVVNG